MTLLYGSTGFELFEPTLPADQLQHLFFNACRVLDARGETSAAHILSSTSFQLSVATNDFGDAFNVLHTTLSVTEYERLRTLGSHAEGKHAFSRIADVLSEIGPCVRCIACFLDTSARHLVAEDSSEQVLTSFTAGSIRAHWQKAIGRQHQDPAGAITAARSLMESVCKHVLDELGADYDDRADLPKLYQLTAKALRLAPSQHTENLFRQILGGCTAVVEGLGSLRNRLGDAHGTGKRQVKPALRHARLASNLAGAVATYLIETLEARRGP